MSTADMLIYVHPALDAKARTHLEKWMSGCIGVDCAEFDHHAHPHALILKYDPDAINGMQLLEMVRKIDPIATRVGL